MNATVLNIQNTMSVCVFVRVHIFSMRQLRVRVMKLKEDHDRIYHLVRTEGMPSINWGNMMDEKLVQYDTCVQNNISCFTAFTIYTFSYRNHSSKLSAFEGQVCVNSTFLYLCIVFSNFFRWQVFFTVDKHHLN